VKSVSRFCLTNFGSGRSVGFVKPRVASQETAALTPVEVLVIIVLLFVLAVLILPGFARVKGHSESQCVNNLKQLGLAYHVWANDHNGKFPMQVSVTNGGTKELTAHGRNPWIVFQVMSNDIVDPKILLCPGDKDHLAASNWWTAFSAKNVSYFVGLDASTNRPKMLLCGDGNFAIGSVQVKSGLLELATNTAVAWTSARHDDSYKPNLWTPTRHIFLGNIGLADGSVMETTRSVLRQILVETRVATNRLAIP
jgi:hypothetical protein